MSIHVDVIDFYEFFSGFAPYHMLIPRTKQ